MFCRHRDATGKSEAACSPPPIDTIIEKLAAARTELDAMRMPVVAIADGPAAAPAAEPAAPAAEPAAPAADPAVAIAAPVAGGGRGVAGRGRAGGGRGGRGGRLHPLA